MLALLAGGALAHDGAQAAPINAVVRAAPDTKSLVERLAYVWRGYDYCWYDDGWRGPDWYVCLYGPWVSGRWWSGLICRT